MRLLLAVPMGLAALVLALPVALVGLPLWVLSALVRNVPRLREPAAVSWRDIVQYDAEIGWKPKPNLDVHYEIRNDDVYRLVTDAEGWPGTRSLDASDVVVFGDSFAFGFGANPGTSFTDLDPAIRAKAVAAPGYSMVQELLLMRQLSHRLAGKLVIWLVYLENDLHDNVLPGMQGYRNPFARPTGDGGWEIVTSHLSPAAWTASARMQPNLLVLAKLCTPSELSGRIYAACRYLIAEARDVTRAAGAQLVVMTAPNVHQLGPAGVAFLRAQLGGQADVDADYPDRMLAATCLDLQVPFVATKPVLAETDYKRFERFHWNASGHRKAARLLAEVYAAHRAGRLAPTPGEPAAAGRAR